MSTVADRVDAARQRIAAAAERAGRSASDVAIVAAKAPSASMAAEALAAGVDGVGENRVAELVAKAGELPGAPWHMVGRLQTNKVKSLPDGLVAIHSVDRLSLVERLARHYEGRSTPAPEHGRTATRPDLYLEVNVTGEPAKGGVAPHGLADLLAAMDGAGLAVAGLMTLAPLGDTAAARLGFRRLAGLAAEHGVKQLSMGMTDDFEIAVEEGSTLVRLGRALFDLLVPMGG